MDKWLKTESLNRKTENTGGKTPTIFSSANDNFWFC